MARGFKSTPQGYSARLEQAEVRLIRQLLQDVIELLGGNNLTGGTQPHEGTPETIETPDIKADEQAGQETPADNTNAFADANSDDIDDQFWQLVAGLDETSSRPEDRAVRRLLPHVFEEQDSLDPSEEVRSAQIEDLQRTVALLNKKHLVLNHDDATVFSRALNLVRVVLSVRLEINTDEDAERIHQIFDLDQAKDVDSYMALLYNFTTWLLETLMDALMGDLDD